MSSGPRTLLTRRGNLEQISWQGGLHDGSPLPVSGSLQGGSVLVRVEAVAFTANTLTYGLLGEQLRYWDFFPTARPGWGCLPAWGTGRVLDSAAAELAPGSRVQGLLPIATHCLLTPVRVTSSSLRDGSQHRRGLPSAYQHYDRLAAATPGTAPPTDDEALAALLRPLFVLGFLLASQLRESTRATESATVVLTSASSKTAQAVAQQLQGSDLRVVGLTALAHVAACAATGLFTTVLSYPGAETLGQHAADGPLVMVDMAGDASLRDRLRAAVPERAVRTVLVGAAHRAPGKTLVATPGEEVFSAVEQLRRLTHHLGPDEFRGRQERAWRAYLDSARQPVRLLYAHDPTSIERAYSEVLHGRCHPGHGHVLRMEPS
ncbi:MAG: DUF2855 family protein [Actinomycetota bacterium]|nr:DUF2855 family protein [Actinomycetota bacterium]